MKAQIIPLDLSKVTDELGAIKASISALKKQEDVLVQQLKDAGVTEVDGALFRATVSIATVESVDWKSIALKLEPSRQLITGNTSFSTRVTVKVVARKS